jgi:ADP-ribosylglycohydrolase
VDVGWIKKYGPGLLLVALAGCGPLTMPSVRVAELPAAVYDDKVHGAWQAAMAANYIGLAYEGKYLDRPSSADSIELFFPDQWFTDDDTAIEWVDLHILETDGLDPTYAQIRDQWMDHLNNDIWCATLQARQLMDRGVLPPETGGSTLNPEGVWSLDAQLETEVFGLLSPGLPDEAVRRAIYFARVTNSGLAVDVSGFYAAMYSMAFFEPKIPRLIAAAQTRFPPESQVNSIASQVVTWHDKYRHDWRETRRNIRDTYDSDPHWTGSQVNFASTVMALLYGDGDLIQTLTISCLAGWDADNNATTSAGLVGVILGYDNLPEPLQNATDRYFNEDVTDLPKSESVRQIARRTQSLAEQAIRQAGGEVNDGAYRIPLVTEKTMP